MAQTDRKGGVGHVQTRCASASQQPAQTCLFCANPHMLMSSDTPTPQEVLQYHRQMPAGKLAVKVTKPLRSCRDLSTAYSPGVALPSQQIQDTPEKVFEYTAKGNLVAVVSNGTAVLGLGNIGPQAAKPVMEGKAALLKALADVDAFDIELDAEDPEAVIRVVRAIAPTFGGINLEDIKAPECFLIEEVLQRDLDIPVMHDDQHGTAVTSGAALLNALEITQKSIDTVQLVVSGAGAGAIACAKLYIHLGLRPEHIIMCDSQGVIRKDRPDIPAHKAFFATDRPVHTLDEALRDADVFLGLSKADVLTPEALKSMASMPILFALANPDPEIAYALAMATRPDVIVATGRSDLPNQVNNVLGFPYIFRGALDVRARCINAPMKLAALYALAALAKQPVPPSVQTAYSDDNLRFGKHYLLPKPMDPRLMTCVSTAVARAAVDSGVAQCPIEDWDAYQRNLTARIPHQGLFQWPA